MFGLRQTIIGKSLLVLLTSILSAPALAAPGAPGMDTFARSSKIERPQTPGVPKSGHLFDAPGDMGGNGKAVTVWFENFDEMRDNARPNPAEQNILQKPFNQELERVQAFIKTVSTISRRYKRLAGEMRKLSVQDDWSGVKQFRDNAADFYDDEALVYDEMIKPRPPSKTREELIERLNDVKSRADQVALEGKSLRDTDDELRRKLGVHQDRTQDALWAYASQTRAGDTTVTRR